MTKYNLERTGALIHQLDTGIKIARCQYLSSILAAAWFTGLSIYGASLWAVRDCGVAGFFTGIMFCTAIDRFASCIKPHRFYCRARELRKHVLAADTAQTLSTLDHHMEQSEAAFDRLMNS